MSDFPYISVLINTFNRSNILRKCLNAVFNQNYPKEKMEILVLNDASNDDTRFVLSEFVLQSEKNKNLFLFENKSNKGIAYGRYFLGTKISGESELALFLDDDVYLKRESLRELVYYFQAAENIGILGPKIVSIEKGNVLHAANFINSWTGRYFSLNSEKPVKCHWVDPACVIFKSSFIRERITFAPEYYRSHEVVEPSIRVRKLGYDIIYNPKIAVEHDFGTEKRRKPERLYYIYRNKLLVIRRNFPLPNKITALFLICVFGLFKYIIDSVVVNKGLNINEIETIIKAVWHGIIGRSGVYLK